jgi:hypothetical protein
MIETTAVAQPDTDSTRPAWINRNAAQITAVVLVLVAVGLRLVVALRGYLSLDDWALLSRSAQTPLSMGLAFHMFNNHLMPGSFVLTWLVQRTVGLQYWPYAMLLALGELILGLALIRLLRLLVGSGWRILLPLAVVMFCPLTLDSTSWWAVGANMVPMHIAIVWALTAALHYARTRRLRHLLGLVGAVVFGLLFFEKSLLVVPLVFLATACLFVRGEPVRSLIRTVRLYWPAWVALAVVSVGYLALYFHLASSSLRQPSSSSALLGFAQQLGPTTLVTGLFGGPWRWLAAGDGTALAAPPLEYTGLAWIAIIGLITVTTVVRPRAGRAWILAVSYVSLVTALLASTRLGGPIESIAGTAPRYIDDAVPVVAICLALALFGFAPTVPEAGAPAADSRTHRLDIPDFLRSAAPTLATVSVLVLALGDASSTVQFADDWSHKVGRDYLSNARADLAKAPAGTVFFDEAVPTDAVSPLSFPYTLQSNFFAPLPDELRPVFVTAAPRLSMFDQSGHIRPARVTGRALLPNGDTGCGYRVANGATTTLPLDGALFDWDWAFEIGYLASTDTTATLGYGGHTWQFPVQRGLNTYFLAVNGPGDSITLVLSDPTASLCTKQVVIGLVG